MNILFLSEQIYPHGSGAELATYLHAKLLSEADFSVRVVTNKFPGEPSSSQDGKIAVYRLPLFTPLYDKPGTVKYQVLARADALFSGFINEMINWADIVYVPRFWYSTIPIAKAHHKPVITHLHDYIPICPLTSAFNSSADFSCKGNRLICSPKCIYCNEKLTKSSFGRMTASIFLNSVSGPFFSALIGLSDAILCVSKEQKRIISDSDYFASNKISVVHNPFFEKSHPLKGEDFGFLGGNTRPKGFETLYWAVVSLNYSCHKPFKIHIARFLNIQPNFVAELSKIGFSVYGNLSGKPFDEVYEKVRALIVPSIVRECAPYAVVEALLSRRYVIASRIGGIPELVETCKGVTLFDPGNSGQLKEAMERLQSLDKNTLEQLGVQNREAFLRRFSNESALKQFVNVIDHVM